MTTRFVKSLMATALREARKATGHSVATFAPLVSIEPASVYRLEKGSIAPSAETLVRWAEVCGVTVESLAAAATAHDGTEAA